MTKLIEISGNTTITASVSVDVPPSKASSSRTSSSSSSSNLLIFPAILLNEDSVNPDGKAEAFFKSVLSHAIRGGGIAGWYHRKKTTAYKEIGDIQFKSDGFGNQYVHIFQPTFLIKFSSCHQFTHR